jgi:hypothetical protein
LRLAVLLLLAVACQVAAQNTNEPAQPTRNKSDWEIEQERLRRSDAQVVLPALPRNENLVEFWVSNSSSFRFFIDTASVSVDDNHVVRYTLVARSATGVANVSYEAMRCAEGQYKVYAYQVGDRWQPRESEWKRIEPNTVQRWHDELRFRYFCVSKRGGLISREEGLEALRRGGHPGLGGRTSF